MDQVASIIQQDSETMKLPYSEGSVFLVPLEGGAFARGVVARATKRGRVLFGHFYGPRVASADQADLGDLVPDSAILRIRFGDLGLINGTWPVVGRLADWNRSQWAMPDFIRRDPLRPKAWLVRYSDADPGRYDGEREIDPASDFPADVMAGYRAVEMRLDNLLARAAD